MLTETQINNLKASAEALVLNVARLKNTQPTRRSRLEAEEIKPPDKFGDFSVLLMEAGEIERLAELANRLVSELKLSEVGEVV